MERVAHQAVGRDFGRVPRSSMTLPATGDARDEDVGGVLGLRCADVAGHAGLGDMGRVIEPRAGHPIRGELDGLHAPLLETGPAWDPGNFVTVGADALLEQLARDLQGLGVHPIPRTPLLGIRQRALLVARPPGLPADAGAPRAGL